jgi:hypothetical protein
MTGCHCLCFDTVELSFLLFWDESTFHCHFLSCDSLSMVLNNAAT